MRQLNGMRLSDRNLKFQNIAGNLKMEDLATKSVSCPKSMKNNKMMLQERIFGNSQVDN